MRTRVETGTGYELLGSVLSLVIAPEPGEAVAEAAPVLPPAAAAALADAAAVGREPLINVFGFLAGAADGSSAAALLADLRRLEDGELLRVLVGYQRRSMRRATDPALVGAAVDGDRRARAAFLNSSFPNIDHWQASLRILTGPRRVAAARGLVDALERLASTLEASLVSGVERAGSAAATARDLLRRVPVDVAVEQLAAEGEIVFTRAIGQDDVVLNPRGSDRRVYAVVDYGSTLVVSYPAPADGAVGIPPGRLVALGQALGDERRLRILRALSDGPLTIGELAASIGMPRSSLQYHLTVLRTSGLIGRAVDDAETGPLALRRAALSEIEAGLRGYLGLPATDAGEEGSRRA